MIIAEVTRGVNLPNAQHQGVPPQEEPVDIGMYDDLSDEWDVEENVNVENIFAPGVAADDDHNIQLVEAELLTYQDCQESVTQGPPTIP